ncbi:FlgB: flagellar basal-body rod protein FlgB [Gaiella occulta]|uniref:Flagellar basal body rod protein FlgB n=1 Tax=Gaiella occulta TaxID=1002870 RepID=A0A7M2Z1P4_9ACTN|nr:flagellar basal body rod protein FlgB [Gaiella occulta]RDI75975.1 FlgB: flagellar basal-body rod protein FlgB [Gaiella occulta]
MEIFGVTDILLGRALGGAELRQRVIAGNIANVNTPGFRRSDVPFQQSLRDALASGDPARVGAARPQVVQDATTALRADGNNVDVDAEMARLAETQLLHGAVAGLLRDRIAMLRYVINEGRR